MKCVLRWILGSDFEFVPDEVINLFHTAATAPNSDNSSEADQLNYGINFTGNSIDPNRVGLPWSILKRYEDRVSFINQAIEWENVVYFLYSYFWDIPTSWPFIRNIQHPDATRQAFLRSGSARVVLTVRKGWEKAWSWFVDQGSIFTPDSWNPDDHPYMTIAQQIQDYDSTNYHGIPPANPLGVPPVDTDVAQVGTTSSSSITPGATSTSPVRISVASAAGFVVGGVAVIDSWDKTTTSGPQSQPINIQESQVIVTVDDRSITVQGLKHAHDAKNGDYPILQVAAKGVLIAEWFEYTPSKGTFIAIDSNMGSIQ